MSLVHRGSWINKEFGEEVIFAAFDTLRARIDRAFVSDPELLEELSSAISEAKRSGAHRIISSLFTPTGNSQVQLYRDSREVPEIMREVYTIEQAYGLYEIGMRRVMNSLFITNNKKSISRNSSTTWI